MAGSQTFAVLDGTARFIAQVSLYSNTLGVAIAALRQLLDRVELEDVLVQTDALHANRVFWLPRAAWS